MKVHALLLILGIALLSCKDTSGPTGPVLPVDYWPMAVGNEWTFNVFQIDSNGNVHPEYITETITVSGTRAVQGFNVWIMTIAASNGSGGIDSVQGKLAFNSHGDLLSYTGPGIPSDMTTNWQIVESFSVFNTHAPVIVHDSTYSSYDDVATMTEGSDSALTVAAGSFNVKRIMVLDSSSYVNPDPNAHDWSHTVHTEEHSFARDIGPVRILERPRRYTSSSSGTDVVSSGTLIELASYRVH